MRFLPIIGLVLASCFALAEGTDQLELSYEQRKAISELKARGGDIYNYEETDREISLTLPKNFADRDLALIQPILDKPIHRLYSIETKLSEVTLNALITQQPKLKSFEGAGKNLTNKALTGLRHAPDLFFIKLTNTAVTAEFFQQPGFAGFHSLQLNNQDWSAKEFAKLANLDLWYLTIREQKLDAASIVQIAKLKKMQWLSLGECAVDSSAWKLLPEFAHLDRLDLEKTGITAQELPLLKRLTKLRNLSIHEQGLTIEQLLPLAELPHLEEFGCSHLSSEDLLRLDQLINEPRLRENARKGHLAGYAISEEQVKKLGLRHPVMIDLLDNIPVEQEAHWYPPKWLSEAWEKQAEPPVSMEHKYWFPSPREKAEATEFE
jgi:hypothetical protein